MTLTARATTDCAVQHAACDASGRKFDGNLSATIAGPQAQQRAVPVVSIAAPATTPVTEGTGLSFTLTRTGATDAALTVNVSVTESGATLGASPPTTATFAEGSANATLSVPTVDDTTVEAASTVTATVTTGTGYTVASSASSAQGVVESEDLEPITATWSEIPTEHDGASAFWAKMTFSHALSGYSFRSMQSHLFDVTGGRIVKAKRDGQPRNTKWAVQDRADRQRRHHPRCPRYHRLRAPSTPSATAEGRKFDGALSARITGPAAFSVADATVEEAEGATLDFIVTLGRARNESTTVRYATSDGSAHAGDDYTARSATLTFDPNETAKTVSVSVHDDAHDEGAETMTLTLSNPSSGAWIEDATATGTITNTDPMPKAWAVRFGRTIGGHLIDAAGSRFAHDGPSHVTVAGIRLGGEGRAPDSEALREDPFGLPAWATRQREAEAREITAADLALRSTFHLSNRDDAVDGPALSAWGHVATGGFETEEDGVRMDGDVTTGVVGFDAEWAQGLAGIMVSLSEGDGTYALDPERGDDTGTVESTMTGIYPYAKLDLSARVSAWALAGAGSGELTLKARRRRPDADRPLDAHRRARDRRPSPRRQRTGRDRSHAEVRRDVGGDEDRGHRRARGDRRGRLAGAPRPRGKPGVRDRDRRAVRAERRNRTPARRWRRRDRHRARGGRRTALHGRPDQHQRPRVDADHAGRLRPRRVGRKRGNPGQPERKRARPHGVDRARMGAQHERRRTHSGRARTQQPSRAARSSSRRPES